MTELMEKYRILLLKAQFNYIGHCLLQGNALHNQSLLLYSQFVFVFLKRKMSL